jgi:hypothetical protein
MSFDLNKVVNVPLITHPMNWLIVWTVLIFWGFAAHLVIKSFNQTPAAPVTRKTGS